MGYQISMKDRKIKITDALPIEIKSKRKEVSFILHPSLERYGRWTISEVETGRSVIKDSESMEGAIRGLFDFVRKIGVKEIVERRDTVLKKSSR